MVINNILDTRVVVCLGILYSFAADPLLDSSINLLNKRPIRQIGASICLNLRYDEIVGEVPAFILDCIYQILSNI